jgi:hypothetical protein
LTEQEGSGVFEQKDILEDLTEAELDHWMSSSSFGSELKHAERALARLAEEQERLRLLAQVRRHGPPESARILVNPPPPEPVQVNVPRRRKRAARA